MTDYDPRENARLAAGSDGDTLLEELAAFVRRYVVLPGPAPDVLALWAVHTYAIDAADVTPYIVVTSPVKQSGKTRLLEVLELLVRSPLPTSNTSDAALFRAMADCPTLLLDEVDAVFGPRARDREDLRALLNAGFRRGKPVIRIVGDGAKMRVKTFEVFGPKVLAGIGEVPDTIADRSFTIRLKRRARHEYVDRLRLNRPPEDAERLRERCEAWVVMNADALAAARPELPEELSDRGQDAAEPLLAIADLAGADWPERARRAVVELAGGQDVDEQGEAIRLLEDCRSAFLSTGEEKLATARLIDALCEDEEAPWLDYRGQPIKPRRLARILAPFGIKAKGLRIGDATPRGYERVAFEDAWTRWLPATSSSAGSISATSATTAWLSEKQAGPNPNTEDDVAVWESVANSHESDDVADVADSKPAHGDGRDPQGSLSPGADGFRDLLNRACDAGRITTRERHERRLQHDLIVRARLLREAAS